MVKQNFNEALVATIRNSLPPNEHIVSFLSDLFDWNKEAIYRRLRCEITFTFKEVIVIASKLNFSIDTIIRSNKSKRVLFDLHLPQSVDTIELYCEKIEQLTTLSVEVAKSQYCKSLFAINYIPYSWSIYYEQLTLFNFFKWMHQTQNLEANKVINDVQLPQKMIAMRQAWLDRSRSNSEVIYILDRGVFLSVITDIIYFYKRGLVRDLELGLLQKELLSLLEGLEQLTRTGITVTGAKAKVYLSPLDIASNHSYFEYDENLCSCMQVYGIDLLQSYYREACLAQKEWIEYYKKYSVLISQSGEMERYQYFEKQREHISLLTQGKEYFY